MRSLLVGVIALLPLSYCADISLSGTAGQFEYDGHGGLSAGASSRLLYDYPEQQRNEILDYLYKPNFGASLHITKHENGGDVQSTDGTESCFKHTRHDLNFSRGYEYWMMAEAKKRNPNVLTYFLSWGVPGWVGDVNGAGPTYFSDENVQYQVDFALGAKNEYGIVADYTGIWNERAWGGISYDMTSMTDFAVKLRRALDEAGLQHTTIVGADGGIPADYLTALTTNATYRDALGALGRHYPCERAEPEVIAAGKKYWANEDYSTVATWEGAGCWGRSLNQNMVKLNATSTISWSTIWSVYSTEIYYGNGLMYAFQPRTGHYEVNAAIWTTAHTTQFAQPGWRYLERPSIGMLPGGGSYVAMIPPDSRDQDQDRDGIEGTGAHLRASAGTGNNKKPLETRVETASLSQGDFTLVLEKLEGDCLRCKVPSTTAEDVTVRLEEPLKSGRPLHVWLTNSTDQFIQMPDIQPAQDGTFTVHLPRDTIMTITTTTGQAKGSAGPVPASGHWQLPYSDDYESTAAPRPGRYHADNGGSFEVAEGIDPFDAGNQVLLQAQPVDPGSNAWVRNEPQPTTALGDGNWRYVNMSARVLVKGPVPASHLSEHALAVLGVDPAAKHRTGVAWERLALTKGLEEEAESVLPLRSDWRQRRAQSEGEVLGQSLFNATFAGIQSRVSKRYGQGVYLLVGTGLLGSGAACEWELGFGSQSGDDPAPVYLAGGSCPSGVSLSTWTDLVLDVGAHAVLQAKVGGTVVASNVLLDLSQGAPAQGLVGYRSGWHYSLFDDLEIAGETLSTENAMLHSYTMTTERNTFDGFVGMQFHTVYDLEVASLGRYCGSIANHSHTLSVFRDNRGEGGRVELLGSAIIDMATACQQGSPTLRADGMAYVHLPETLHLPALGSYFIVSYEETGGDTFQGKSSFVAVDLGPKAEAAIDTLLAGVYFFQDEWHFIDGDYPQTYGPVDALFA